MRKGMHRGHSFPLGVPFFRKELRMWKYIVKRLLWMIPVLLGIAVVIFTIMYFCPGDPAASILGNGATPAALEAKRAEMGLDKPYIVRLLNYLNQVFLHFDLGDSYFTNQSVMSGIYTGCRIPLP